MSTLTYLFYPNPANASYTGGTMLLLLIVCALIVAGSIGLRFWRKRQSDAQLRKLSRSWASAALWFGIAGLVLVVSRVEEIQYIAMRFWWIVWALILALYVFLQAKLFRARYYQVLPATAPSDPRSKYLPGKKKKS